MSQYHKIISAGIAIAFVVVVQSFSVPVPVFRFLIPAVVLCTLVAQMYNYFYLKETNSSVPWTLIRLTIFFIAWFGLFSLIHVVFLRGIFLVLSVPFIYLFERSLNNFGEHIVLNEVLLIAWAVLLSSTGLMSYFHLANVLIIFLQFAAILLLVRSSISFLPEQESVKWIGSLALALFVAELSWAVNFLPLHYSASAMLIFSVFYVVFTLYYYSLYNTLSWKRVQLHIGLSVALIFAVILTTPWKVIT